MSRENVAETLRALIRPLVPEGELPEALSESSSLTGDLGIQSMHLLDLVIEVEDAFDIEIDPEETDGLVTVGNVLDLIESKTQS